jgi:phosphatidylinositol glycan class O
MDTSGDHGGDGVLETSSGLWIYSKDFPLFNSTRRMPPELLDYRTFPGSSVKSRAIEQIDLVPASLFSWVSLSHTTT